MREPIADETRKGVYKKRLGTSRKTTFLKLTEHPPEGIEDHANGFVLAMAGNNIYE